MRTISVRLDDGSEARLDSLCKALGLSQTDVVKAGLELLQRQSASPAALAERLGLIGSFSSGAPGSASTSRGARPFGPTPRQAEPAACAATVQPAGSMSSASFRGATIVDTGPLVAWFDLVTRTMPPARAFLRGTWGLSFPLGRCSPRSAI